MTDNAVTLVGAGLAGSLLAVYLARRGHRVTVYERRPDRRGTDVSEGRSINLALANRGIRALRKVGLYKEIAPLLIPMRGRMLHELDGATSLQPYGKDPSEVIYSISRGGLNALLLDAAERHGVRLRFAHCCEAIDLDSGVLTLRDEANGSVHSTAPGPVIATDGAGSAVRRAMVERPGFTASENVAEHAYKELEIPAAADGTHAIEARALHIWPRGGFMLIALPNLDGSFTVTLFLARDGAPGFSELDTPEAVTAFFERTFPDATALMPRLAE
ncbi:MAG: NAD(P)/FAD-dependent oxidoreductase, partial [Pseudomonadota bacterium]